jgi:CRISPR-associated protein Csd2
MNNMHIDPSRRHDFVLLFDVTDGNPNGDPDAGNLPRVDPETMQGLVTDVCIKRKIRDFANQERGKEERFKIYVEHKGVLNPQHERAYTALGKKPTARPDRETQEKARQWMCENFYDIRLFGAVMTTGVNCGQVRGPVQFTFGRSVDPIVPLDISITRVAVTREQDAVAFTVGEDEEAGGKVTEMGRKALVPYGLYRAHGFFNPHFAEDTGADEEDLKLLWDALGTMWEIDRSAARGMMACRGVYIFTHDNKIGRAPAHKLFKLVQIERNDGVEAPRSFGDYRVSVDEAGLPEGVHLTKLYVE